MSQTRCSNGHFFDAAVHASCPYCNVAPGGAGETLKVGNATTSTPEQGATVRMGGERGIGMGETVRITPSRLGIDPVVGWLICVSGPEKGKDYRIRSERNFIGRATNQDICIAGDESISRERHAILTFNPKSASFAFVPGDSHGLVYCNDQEVMTPIQLQPYDRLEMGKSQFLFVPFCGERFQWVSEESFRG